jgi:hypothetical protein
MNEEGNQLITKQKETPMVATPKLGIIKGIIIIFFGIIWLNNYSLGALIGYKDLGNKNILLSVIWGLVIFGLLLWRGIVAICKRKSLRVTTLNFGIWIFLFVISSVYVLWITN